MDAPKVDRMSDAKPRADDRRAVVVWIGLYQVLVAVLLLVLLFAVWPERVDRSGWRSGPLLDALGVELGDEARMLLIVVAAGALGSHVHAATSFASFVGNNRLEPSWTWWYLLRPFIGMPLALTVYFVIRGGLLSK